jgi:tetratricopeptide (TPR) repeat protein
MTELEVKKEAKLYYSKGDYQAAFAILNNLPANEFVQYAQAFGQNKDSNKWLTSTASRDVFWGEFMLAPETLCKFFESDQANHILHLYFTQAKEVYPSFLSALANLYPVALVKGIRLSSAFLKDEHFSSFDFFQHSENEYLSLHYQVFKRFRTTENSLWQEVKEWSSILEGYVLNSALFEVVLWVEAKHFEAKFDLTILHHLATVYSTFVEWFAHVRGNKLSSLIKNFNEPALDEKFYQLFASDGRKSYDKITGGPIFRLLDAISDWVDFKEGILSSYCHDMNYLAYMTPIGLELNSDSESHYKWKLDGERYFLTHSYYVAMAAEFVEEAVESGNIIIPRKESSYDYQRNKALCINNYATKFFFNDLCIDTINFNRKEIPASLVFLLLQALSGNRSSRIEIAKQEYSKTAKSWYDMYALIFRDSMRDTIRREPFWSQDCEGFIAQSKTVLNDNSIKEGELETVVEIESHDIEKNGEYFDRFNIRYNVFFNPFLKIGNCLFTPVIFLANNFVFFNVAQLGLRQSTAPFNQAKTNQETLELEKHLANIFTGNHWKVTHIKPEQSNEFDGDVDLIVDDGNELLFIQLKRTYFRLNLKDAHFEGELIDKHASEQLNDATNCIKGNSFLKSITGNINRAEPKRITKWIVSTSFESCGTLIDGCLKVNYFELIAMLQMDQCEKISELVSSFEGNSHLKHLGLTTDVFTPDSHRRILEVTNAESAQKFATVFNQGIELNQAGEYSKAQTSFLECLKIYPEELTSLHMLANAYADTRQYSNALETFDRALTMSPEEPTIWLDKANCLWENLQYQDAIIEFLKIFRKYRLFGLEETIIELFKRCTENGLLKEESYLKLKQEFDELKK